MYPLITPHTAGSIQEKFSLPPAHEYSQEWELETSVPGRLEELLKGYSDRLTNDDERVCLMALILNSYIDISQKSSRADSLWASLLPLLQADIRLHSGLIAYFSCPGDPEEESFAIAGRLRSAFPDIVAEALRQQVEEDAEE